MQRIPHAVIEGAVITCHAIGANTAFIYLRGEYLQEFESWPPRSRRPRRPGYVGPNVARVGHVGHDRHPPRRRRLHLRRGDRAPRVARGQARPAALEAAVPGHLRRLRLADAHQQRRDDRDRPDDRSKWAARSTRSSASRTRRERGVFSLSGNVANGGNYELELGTPLRELDLRHRRRHPGRTRAEGLIPGGSSVPVLTADEIDTPLDFDSMAAAGTMLGSGAVIVIDDRACMVQLGLRVAQFYMHESCGKCTPCREGTRWMVQILRKLEDGRRRAGRARPAPRRLRPDPRQLPLPARRRGGDADRELRREVPRGVPAAHRRGRLSVRRRVVARRRDRAGRPAPRPPARPDRGPRPCVTCPLPDCRSGRGPSS